MEFISTTQRRHLIRIILIGITLIFFTNTALAAPPRPPGRIVFIGKTANGERSVWLSITTAGSFEVEARQQVVDEWTQAERGLHVTFSPIVSNGSGDPHSLFTIINGELVFIDKDNQQGGIDLPPFPGGLPPGEVSPPIALPPGDIFHPIVLPPEVSVPPTTPGDISPPSFVQGDQAQSSSNSRNSRRNGFTNAAPLTPGRQFAKEPSWNIWADGRYFGVNDHRFGLDRNGEAANITIGADHRFTNDLVVGAMVAHNKGNSSSFDNTWQTNARGFTLGPYFGYRLSKNWAIDGTLGYGQLQNQNDIAILNSRYTTEVYTSSLIATGVYDLGTMQLRPKPAIYYNYFHNPGYNMYANVSGIAFTVPIAAANAAIGFSQFAVEASRPFTLANGKITTVPYVELGVDYAFARPNGGEILTGDLTMRKTSPWSGLARLGVRTMITRTLFIETTASYLSFGQPNLNLWEGRVFLSWALG